MNRRSFRRAAPLVIGALALVFVALLPVTVPTADESGVPLPGIPTVAPSANSAGAPATRPIGGVYGNIGATQQFPAIGEQIDSVALFLGTYRRTNQGTFQVAVEANVAGQWQNLATRTADKATIKDNDYYTLTFSPPLTVTSGQPLQIILTSAGGSGDAITWLVNSNWQPQGYALFYNDKPEEGAARFLVSYASRSGRLFQVLGPIWSRLTLFLTPLWQAVLVVGLCILAGSFVALGRHLTR